MPRLFTNDFSWSKSRHEKFSECLRAYYFYYYRSWGGWEASAPKEVRELYVLKKLGNRYSWAGTVVHDSIKKALLEWKDGRPVDPAEVEARARKQMQDDFRFSRQKGYWTPRHGYRKAFAGLVEHEYGEAVSNEAWKQNWETVAAALGWFFASRWPELARSLKPQQWLEVDESLSNFTLDGVKVFAIPDFAYVDASGTPVVVDWKTGRAREGYDEQVLGYALYISQRYKFPVERVRASLVYLNEGQEQDVQVDPAAMEGFKARLTASVARMRELLADPAANTPKGEAAFPRTEELNACVRCAFRRPCGRADAQARPQVA